MKVGRVIHTHGRIRGLASQKRRSERVRESPMPEKNYQDRDPLDKLGIKPGHVVAFANEVREIDQDLSRRILERTGRPLATDDEALDVVLAVIDETVDAAELLKRWRQ